LSKTASDGLRRQPTFWTRKRLAIAIALIFAGGITAAALDLRFVVGGAPRSVEPNSVLVLDPATADSQKAIVLGSTPSAVTVGTVSVGGRVRRIDTARSALRPGQGTAIVPVGVCAGTRLLRLDGNGWVACEGTPALLRVSPAGVVTPVAGVSAAPAAAAYGAGRVWVVEGAQNRLVAINPFTARIVQQVTVGSDPAAVAVGFGAVWVANAGNGTITRLDLRNGKIETIGLDDPPNAIAAGAGAVWVVSRVGKAVIRIDPKTKQVTKTVRLANPPLDVAAGGGHVWVAIGH
jgi:streptogramin lyase